MADETKADPAALRAYSADMRMRVATTRHALGDYQMAVAAFNAAPKEEVEHTIPDRSGVIAANLDWLAFVDAQPELFADALETVDRTAFPSGLVGEWLYAGAVQRQFLDLLAVEHPDLHATVVEELRQARLEDMASRDYWRAEALQAAGIDEDGWLPQRGLAANDDTVQAVYAYYAGLYETHPELQWAGMGALAGATVYGGLQDLHTLRRLPPDERLRALQAMLPAPGLGLPGGMVLPYLARVGVDGMRHTEQTLLKMQADIFVDLAWQHEAYRQGGIDMLRALADAGQLRPQQLRAWEGIASGAPARVAEGNERLLRREQEDVIQRDYDRMRTYTSGGLPVGEWLMALTSVTAESPVPGDKPMREVVTTEYGLPLGLPGPTVTLPSGDVSVFADRWEWIEGDMLPAYQQALADDEAMVAGLIATPVAERAEQFRLVPPVFDGLAHGD